MPKKVTSDCTNREHENSVGANEQDEQDERDYLYGMLAQLAVIARQCGELDTALLLDGIVTGRRI